MHAPYDRSRDSRYRNGESKAGFGLLLLPVIVTIVLITLAVHPKSSMWISQAVKAEFGGYGIANDMPVETAQPPGMTAPIQTVHAD